MNKEQISKCALCGHDISISSKEIYEIFCSHICFSLVFIDYLLNSKTLSYHSLLPIEVIEKYSLDIYLKIQKIFSTRTENIKSKTSDNNDIIKHLPEN